MDRRIWAGFLAVTACAFGILEAHALRSRRGYPEDPPASSEKAGFPTLSAYVWDVAGIHPRTGRRHVVRPLLGLALVYLTGHLLFMVPWPWEDEVIRYVRKRARRS